MNKLIENNTHQIKYDKHGRMKYNPDFHARQYEPWTTQEELYLIKYYKIDGLKTMSMALERKETSVYGKVQHLRQRGFIF